MKKIKQLICIGVMMALIFTCMPLANGRVYAASKKPAAPVITYAEASGDNETNVGVDIRWKKAKKAKKYQIAIRSATKEWVKVKTVKKTAKNKRKYTKKNKYMVVARGKKYKVYKYQYTYMILRETKGSSIRIRNTDRFEFDFNTTYVFAVRSVNGKKRSNWRTAVVKTGQDSGEGTLTRAGEKTTVSFNGQSLTITVGKECALPVPQIGTAPVEAEGVTFTPKEIYYWYYDAAADVRVTGKTADGFDAYWSIRTEYDGSLLDVRYNIEHPTFNKDESRFHFIDERAKGYGELSQPRGRTKFVSDDSDVTIIWTLDGTCPPQDDSTSIEVPKTINASDYPFGKVVVFNRPYNGDLQVRGKSTYGNDTYMWPSEHTRHFKRCEWIRVYKGYGMHAQLFYADFKYGFW